MKLVFVGGKGAPSNYEVGMVYELSERYMRFPWFKAVPDSIGAGEHVDVKPSKPEPRREAVPEPAPWQEIPVGLEGVYEMVFNGRVKGAPSSYVDGQAYMLPIRYARFPWFRLTQPLPEIKAPPAVSSVFVEKPKIAAVTEKPKEVLEPALPYEEPPLESTSAEELEKFTKTELMEKLKELGGNPKRRMTREDLIKQISDLTSKSG